jgi:hypothetical protein
MHFPATSAAVTERERGGLEKSSLRAALAAQRNL